MDSQPDAAWSDDIKRVIAWLDDALQTVRMLHPAINATMASDVWPPEPPEPGTSLHYTLYYELQRARKEAIDLCERLSSRPAADFLDGRLLSAEEFHALGADGITWPDRAAIGLAAPADVTDYELYRLFHFEDDRWRGLINPAAKPRDQSSGRIGLCIGRPPEEIPRAQLRPEQEEFFAKHLPQVLARFA